MLGLEIAVVCVAVVAIIGGIISTMLSSAMAFWIAVAGACVLLVIGIVLTIGDLCQWF